MESFLDLSTPEVENRRRRWRMIKDRAFGWTMAVGGIGVIITIVMTFFYLFYVVLPMFAGARTELIAGYQLPFKGSDIAHLAIDEYAEVGLAITTAGDYSFFATDTGMPLDQGRIAHSDTNNVVARASGDPTQRTVILAFDDGTAVVVRPNYEISYPNDRRQITPSLEYPLGTTPFDLGHGDEKVSLISVQLNDEETTIVSATEHGGAVLTHLVVTQSLLGDQQEITTQHVQLPKFDFEIRHLLIDVDQRELYVASAAGRGCVKSRYPI